MFLYAFVATLILVSLFVGCGPDDAIALIHYSQLGACTQAQTGNGQVVAPASHAIVIFRITTIDNSEVGKSWSFDSTSLEIDPSAPQNLGGLGPVPIAANKVVPVNAVVGIIVETENIDGSDVGSVNYTLLYPLKSPAPGTISVKDNFSQTSYPFVRDCNVIAGG